MVKIRSEAANKGPVAVIDMFTCLHSYHRKEYVNKQFLLTETYTYKIKQVEITSEMYSTERKNKKI